MSTPLDPIYCRKCHRPLSRTATVCDACQWDQFKRFDPKAEARRKAEEAEEADRAARQRPVSAPLLALFPEEHKHLAIEMTRQYRKLVCWQIAGMLMLLDGPILLFALWLGNLLPVIFLASVLFPVAISFIPLATLGGLVYAIFRKPGIRQKIAEMGVDAQEWSVPMDRPIRKFWILTIGFTVLSLLIGSILSKVGQSHRQGGQRQYNQRNSPTLYE